MKRFRKAALGGG